jgi:hypothetical protein
MAQLYQHNVPAYARDAFQWDAHFFPSPKQAAFFRIGHDEPYNGALAPIQRQIADLPQALPITDIDNILSA